MITILEMILLVLCIVGAALLWAFFLYTSIRDDIRSERSRKKKIEAGEDPDRWRF